MTLVDTIQAALKSKNVVIGFRESIKHIKLMDVKLIVIAKNIPDRMKREIEQNAKVGDMKIETFDGSSKELGIICGKHFPITSLVIK